MWFRCIFMPSRISHYEIRYKDTSFVGLFGLRKHYDFSKHSLKRKMLQFENEKFPNYPPRIFTQFCL